MHVFVAKPTYLRGEWSRTVETVRTNSAIDFAKIKSCRPANGIIVVGKGASMTGEITNCSRVEIAGELEGNILAQSVVIRAGGRVNGTVCAEEAEVSGTIEGQLLVERHLDIGSTGMIIGELSYGSIEIAPGGRIAGSIQLQAQHLSALAERTRALTVLKPSVAKDDGHQAPADVKDRKPRTDGGVTATPVRETRGANERRSQARKAAPG
jgi:cytoskeletal protein CcmA (bactofilin family)